MVTLTYILAGILLLPVFHDGTDAGIFAGLLHPFLGLDHLLAMVAVGLLSAQMGGRAIWTVPATFVGVMAVGGGLGLIDIGLPGVEYGIVLSVVILGAALAAQRDLPAKGAMAFVGFFALFHGYAHGLELPSQSDTTQEIFIYVFGFLVATATLHLIGALIGQLATSSARGNNILRLSGATIAIVGVFLLFNI